MTTHHPTAHPIGPASQLLIFSKKCKGMMKVHMRSLTALTTALYLLPRKVPRAHLREESTRMSEKDVLSFFEKSTLMQPIARGCYVKSH